MYQAVFIDAGHGKSTLGLKDPGAVARYGDRVYTERSMVAELGRKILDLLTVKLKGTLIQGVGIETEATPFKKMQFVNSVIRENRFAPARCVGVALHMNSSISSKANGFELWYQKQNQRAEKFARVFLEEWEKYNILPLRPSPMNNTKNHWKYHRLYIDDALCPFVLLELGFMSNFADLSIILKNLDRTAECIAHSIIEFDKE